MKNSNFKKTSIQSYKGFVLTSLLLAVFAFQIQAQETYLNTFNDRRVINTQSVEMLSKNKLDIRIAHRFGDLLGNSGGWQTFYGLESAADITIGGEYGVTDNFNIGLFRAKGAGELRQNVSGFVKFRIIEQGQGNNTPLSITMLGESTISTMPQSDSPGILSSFQKFSHRFSYHMQAMFARKFGERISLQASLNYTYRNAVYTYEINDLPSMGIAGKIQISKVVGFLFDTTIPFIDQNSDEKEYYIPLGFGFEFDTGGHVFQVNLTNAKGIAETDYIPYSSSNWLEGEYRLGFTISRIFNL